jgi:hypothetical protein
MGTRNGAILFRVLLTLLFTTCMAFRELPDTSITSSPVPTATPGKVEGLPGRRQALEAM